LLHPLEPVVFDEIDPRRRGHAHGEMWREEIREVAELRTALCIASIGRAGYRNLAELDAVAAAHLPILARELPALSEELLGIAEGADLSPERIVVLNHYTDLRDIRPSTGEGDGCTAIYLSGPHGPVLGQTWDMHASAAPFVRMIRVAPKDGTSEVLCLTLTGCLGMAGIGRSGVAVTINNLTSTDAKVGLVWPALVRSMLEADNARVAYERLLAAPLSSGHHYMIADGTDFFGVETSGELKVLTQVGPKAAHVHTNHCFDPVLRGRENVARDTSSFARLDMATTLYLQQRPRDLDGVWAILGNHDGHPRSICSHVDTVRGDPSASRTCARMAMELWSGRVRVAPGCSTDDRPLELGLAGFVARTA
jgi:isopenicillin-N N-acyltransferase-like protein